MPMTPRGVGSSFSNSCGDPPRGLRESHRPEHIDNQIRGGNHQGRRVGAGRRVAQTGVQLSFDRDQSLKVGVGHHGVDEPDGVRSMPTEIIVIASIMAAFAAFAATLYWADLRTRGLGR
jgi:hypothetical protein